ncbi:MULTISPECIES: hypothetical protein [Pasteurellaceae]|uniref:hypothetical protein n=1 Tax=Pasteurellaceae TaxID=712 RepID=UPI001E32DF10|nr:MULTISPECIES: hypothetical protein [Pasteurellaceae]MDX3904010.1 hypothetical protein [Pasteurella multocida]MDX3983559.1 hypothetical protein [Pasteurella multocida]UFK41746.1 hypothetical protein LO774_08315 [Mannheimia haemolytica]HDL1114034.1 hypothetical protein [Mannheimia haemolytica]HDL1115382.1 hypothetical protein [Mannheimia haemolytica]
MTNEQILSIAQEYRQSNKNTYPFMLEHGYIRIFQGKAYGWCAEKGEAKTERPTALIVSLSGEVFEATGGNDINGAKRWKKYNVNF